MPYANPTPLLQWAILEPYCNICTCICAFVMFLTRITNVYFYIQIYVNICFHVSLRGHNLGTFYARKLKFGMLFTQTLTFKKMLELPLDDVWRVGLGVRMYNNKLSIWKIVVEIYDSWCCCHMGKEQKAGAFVYFVCSWILAFPFHCNAILLFTDNTLHIVSFIWDWRHAECPFYTYFSWRKFLLLPYFSKFSALFFRGG